MTNFYIRYLERAKGMQLVCLGNPIVIKYKGKEIDLIPEQSYPLAQDKHILPIQVSQDWVCIWIDSIPLNPNTVKVIMKKWKIPEPNFHQMQLNIAYMQKVWDFQLIAMDSHHATLKVDNQYTVDLTLGEYETITIRTELWKIRPYYITLSGVYLEGTGIDLPWIIPS